MAYNNSIQPSLPPDTGESPSLGASRIRNLKSALIERFNSWIYGFDTAGAESEVGVKSLPLRVQSSAPSTPVNGVALYSKDVSGKAEAFIKDEDGDEVQLTNNGTVGNVGDYADKSLNTEYLAETNILVMADVSAFNTCTLKIASDINFSSLILNTTIYYGSLITAVVKKGYYYRIQSSSSGTYKVISI